MGNFSDEFVKKIYSLPKTPEAVSEFLNSYYDEVQPNGKVLKRQMWERFEAPYVKVTRHYVRGTEDDEADIYLYAHKLLCRCVCAEVGPYFESDGQLFSYFQLMVRNTRINNAHKAEKDSIVLLEGDISNGLQDDDEVSSVFDFATAVVSTQSVEETPEDRQKVIELYEMFDSFTDEDGNPDDDLVLFGRLFVDNSFSFDGMYGLCGFDLKKFKDVKKRFIVAVKKYYGKAK